MSGYFLYAIVTRNAHCVASMIFVEVTVSDGRLPLPFLMTREIFQVGVARETLGREGVRTSTHNWLHFADSIRNHGEIFFFIRHGGVE